MNENECVATANPASAFVVGFNRKKIEYKTIAATIHCCCCYCYCCYHHIFFLLLLLISYRVGFFCFLPLLCPLEIAGEQLIRCSLHLILWLLRIHPKLLALCATFFWHCFSQQWAKKRANIMNQAILFHYVLFHFILFLFSSRWSLYCEWLICNTIYLTLYVRYFALKI